MIQRLRYLLLAVMVLATANLIARQVKASAGKSTPVKVFKPGVYLGSTGLNSGTLHKGEVEKMLHELVTSHDSTGKKYKVVAFDFTYMDRNLYEDSVGNLIVVPDYLNQHCHGDSIPSEITANLKDRVKGGDTIFYYNVQVVRYQPKTNLPMPDSTAFLAKSMKFAIVK